MQYVVHAYDFTDEHGLARRMAVRGEHLAGARALKANGQFVLGGALLDPEGRMIGSMMLVDFATEADLHAWLAVEPYITELVWERVDIKPFRLADV